MSARRYPRQRYVAQAIVKRAAARHGFPARETNAAGELVLRWRDGMTCTIDHNGHSAYDN